MCYAFKAMGLFPLLPVTVLLTVSFFVLVTLRRLETKPLRAFGYVVAVLLWISALAVVYSGPGGMGKCPMMQGRPPMMMQAGPGSAQMPPMMMKDCQKAKMQQAAPAETKKEKPGAKKNF